MTGRRLGPAVVAVLAGARRRGLRDGPDAAATTSPATATAPAVDGAVAHPAAGRRRPRPRRLRRSRRRRPAGLSRGSPVLWQPGIAASRPRSLDQPASGARRRTRRRKPLRGYLHTPGRRRTRVGRPTGWRVVERSATSVTWIAPGDRDLVDRDLRTRRRWLDVLGGRRMPPPDRAAGRRRLRQLAARSGTPPAPDATTIHVLGTETAAPTARRRSGACWRPSCCRRTRP